MKKNLNILALLLMTAMQLQAQQPLKKDKAVFKEYVPGYYENVILRELIKNNTLYEPYKYLSVVNGENIYPNDTSLYTKMWHNPAVSQGNTGTCWAFGSIAMMESDIYRQYKIKVKLSEMYVVYYDYIERARDFVKTRGKTYYAEGSESNALVRMMKLHGIVPYSAYSGLLSEQRVYDHSVMIETILSYLEKVKEDNFWNEQEVVKTTKSILNSYMGKPPSQFQYKGVAYTPETFLKEYLKIIPSDYFSFMSTQSAPFNQKGELVEKDNWWHSQDYYNVCLDDYMRIITDAVKNGYTICICGDVSEPGIDSKNRTCIIPSFDIPSEYINDNSRQMRLSDERTTDDHCMELVGYCIYEGKYWFLIKDSGAGVFGKKPEGYRFMSEDYVKLKMMNLLLYKYAAKSVLDKIIK